MLRELLIIVLFGLFRGVIVVNHCFNYSRVYLQFVQPVSSFFVNKCFLNLSRELLIIVLFGLVCGGIVL